ncbi:MAG: GrpB family protein [bacterium]|nr:GrpB family protein [bacterium]
MTFQTKEVVVVPYQDIWKEQFHFLALMLSSIVKPYAQAIEHVGSTSIVGCFAKPIIDVDIIVRQFHFDSIKNVIEDQGYVFRGDLGIPQRYAFSGPDVGFKYHLYVCIDEAPSLKEHLLLRNYLLTHELASDAYSTLKQQLATTYRFDIDSYIDGKSAFIQDTLIEARKHSPINRPMMERDIVEVRDLMKKYPHIGVRYADSLEEFLQYPFPSPWVIEQDNRVLAVAFLDTTHDNQVVLQGLLVDNNCQKFWIDELHKKIQEQALIFHMKI